MLKINVAEGDSISEGDVIMIIEAMKMETEIKASEGGRVASVNVNIGEQVKTGQVLVTLG